MARRSDPTRARAAPAKRRKRKAPHKPPRARETYYFDTAAAHRAVRFFETCVVHVEGPKAGQPFLLERWQRKIIRDVFGWKRRSDRRRRYRIVFVAIPKKNGKLLHIKEMIPTPAGWTKMGDLQPGDLVFDHLGQPTPVVAVSEIEHPVTYRLRFSDGTEIVAGADHEWYTEARVNGFPKWRRRQPRDSIRTTAQIAATLVCERDTRRGLTSWNHRIPLAHAIECGERPLPIPPYTLGVWLGDGSRGSGGVTKKIPADAAVIMARVRAEGVEVRGGQKGSWYFIGLVPALRALGILDAKAIPTVYLRASIEQRLALVAGLMDTDGFCSPAGQCEFSTTAPGLRDGMLELLRSLGYKPTLKTQRARLNGRDYGEVYRIQFWAYADSGVFTIPRKANRQKPAPAKPTRASSRWIVSADVVPTVPMRCIQVGSPAGLYLAGEGMIPTHNSSFAAGVSLYLLAADGEIGGQIFSAAADKEQAALVFEIAKKMVEASPALTRRIKIFRRSLVHAASGSSYRVLSADAYTKHGLNASGVIFDELHTQPNRDLYDTLKGATGARAQPLVLYLTTAGFERTSICFEEWEYARAVRDGAIEDPRYYAVIYEAPAEADYRDPKVWRRANPNLDRSISEEFLAGLAAEAQQRPASQNAFRRLHLNIWTQSETRWIDPDVWAAAPPLAPLEELRKRKAYGGLDLASTTDLTAFALVFPPDDLDHGLYSVLLRFWIPEDGLALRVQRDRVPYDAWLRDGFVTATPGARTDYGRVKADLVELSEEFEIVEIAYDRWGAAPISNELEAEGFTMVQVNQGIRGISAPAKAFEGLVVSGRLAHGGHPVLAWNAENVVVHQDANENIKPDKKKSREKIDGVIATIMALDRAQRHEPPKPPPEITLL